MRCGQCFDRLPPDTDHARPLNITRHSRPTGKDGRQGGKNVGQKALERRSAKGYRNGRGGWYAWGEGIIGQMLLCGKHQVVVVVAESIDSRMLLIIPRKDAFPFGDGPSSEC